MGTASPVDGRAPIHTFYSPRSWIEGNATQQLETVAALPGVKAVAGMPDLHPGKCGPVGCSILADRIHPQLVGSDIGCGMGLFQLDLAVRKLRVDKAAERLRALDGAWDGDPLRRLAEAGLAPTPFDASLGTIGGGNHFCELQAIEAILEPEAAAQAGLDRSRAYVLVHSGSRGLGYAILQRQLAAVAPRSTPERAGRAYLAEHDLAVRWAALNRRVHRDARGGGGRAELQAVADLSHNLVEVGSGGVLHRKGTAPADRGLVPIPGSRGTLSYLVEPLAPARPEALASLAHGAGRKYDRASMHGRIRTGKSRPGRARPQSVRRCDRMRGSRSARRGGARGLQEHRSRDRRSGRFRPGARGRDVPAARDLQDRAGIRRREEATRQIRAGGAAMIRLLFTSGRGPEECRIALAKALAVFAREAEAAGLDVEVAAGPDPDGHGPASAIARLEGRARRHSRRPGSGRSCWVARSPLRPHHKRKNWFIGVFELEPRAIERGRAQSRATCASRRSVPVDPVASTRTRPRAPSGRCMSQRGSLSSRATDARSTSTSR